MLPRELIELLGRFRATGVHVLETLADSFDRLLIILTLPLEVVGKDVVEGVGDAFPTPPRELFELSQPLRLYRQRLHASKVEVRELDVNLMRRAAIGGVDARAGRVLGNFRVRSSRRRRIQSRTKVIDPTEAIAERRRQRASGDPSGEPTRETPAELQAIEDEMVRQHWEDWLDTRVPALGNKTPRQAARTAGGRERVEALLAEFDRGRRRTTERGDLPRAHSGKAEPSEAAVTESSAETTRFANSCKRVQPPEAFLVSVQRRESL
jgi:hypothetical protein